MKREREGEWGGWEGRERTSRGIGEHNNRGYFMLYSLLSLSLSLSSRCVPVSFFLSLSPFSVLSSTVLYKFLFRRYYKHRYIVSYLNIRRKNINEIGRCSLFFSRQTEGLAFVSSLPLPHPSPSLCPSLPSLPSSRIHSCGGEGTPEVGLVNK